MIKSSYAVLVHNDRWVLLRDNNIGMSITNDAEAVVEQINESYPDRKIFYIDTNGDIDELVHRQGVFIEFNYGISSATVEDQDRIIEAYNNPG